MAGWGFGEPPIIHGDDMLLAQGCFIQEHDTSTIGSTADCMEGEGGREGGN